MIAAATMDIDAARLMLDGIDPDSTVRSAYCTHRLGAYLSLATLWAMLGVRFNRGR